MTEKTFNFQRNFQVWDSKIGEHGKSAHFQSNTPITKEENLNHIVINLAFPTFHFYLHMVMYKNPSVTSVNLEMLNTIISAL